MSESTLWERVLCSLGAMTRNQAFSLARASVACEEASFPLYVRRVLTGRERKTEKKQILCARHHARGIYKRYFAKSSNQL